MLTPSTCSRSQASSFPGLQKAGQGPGNETTHSSGRTGEGVIKTRMLLCGLDEVGQLLYEVHLLTAQGVWQVGGHKFS